MCERLNAWCGNGIDPNCNLNLSDTCVQNINTYYCKTDNIVVIQNTLNKAYGKRNFSSMLGDPPSPDMLHSSHLVG